MYLGIYIRQHNITLPSTQGIVSADYLYSLQYVDYTVMIRGLFSSLVTGTCDPFAVHYTCNPMRDVWG